MDIVAVLTAGLNEDERQAKLATAGPWLYDPSKQWQDPGDSQLQGQECVTYGTPPPANSPAAFGPPLRSGGCIATTGAADDLQSMMDAAHIARHDPARVLAEVAAKRRMLERHSGFDFPANEDDGPGDYAWTPRSDGHCYGEVWPCADLRDLAAPYADQPDYNQGWRP